jgi:hypothetical protein
MMTNKEILRRIKYIGLRLDDDGHLTDAYGRPKPLGKVTPGNPRPQPWFTTADDKIIDQWVRAAIAQGVAINTPWIWERISAWVSTL